MITDQIRLYAKIELARRYFWDYCKLVAPDFYRDSRDYLRDLCETLQRFYESDKKILVVNMPPRHGKSRTATLFVQWLFGENPKTKVMTGSYNETLSTTFAKQVRDKIWEEKTDGVLVYSDIFPDTKIKYGESSAAKWALEGSEQTNYLATSPTGTATGFGCNIMLIDDLIKSAEEAYNENTLLKHVEWFNNTMLSRTETGFKLIIIMTRWATGDLAGYILDNFDDVEHINYKAVQDDGTMLCNEILTPEDYEFKTKNMNIDIVKANYQQEPIDIKGRLYSSFKTYDGNLPEFKEIRNYTDTADTGEDFLCSINYGVTFANEAYILDVLYTKEAMEITEPATAKMIYDGNVNVADIESNNGGRGFSRAVERIMQSKYGSNRTSFRPFTQHKNKIARILSNATWVMEHVYFPANWRDRWPEYHEAMIKYQKEGKNAHDDAPDATTGIAEKMVQGATFSFD
ncbi:MAG: phage terminase large subunit [Alphaproteobacteria bacterium]|nr:phage terminase large subunit [Alphaproteobacteria bacterium]